MTAEMGRFLARTASGESLSDFAEEEFISVGKAELISFQVRDRLGAKSLAQACAIAFKLGYLTIPDENGIVRYRSRLAEASNS